MNDLLREIRELILSARRAVVHSVDLTVDYILNLLAHGATEQEICEEYNSLMLEDVWACLLFTNKALENTEFMPLAAN